MVILGTEAIDNPFLESTTVSNQYTLSDELRRSAMERVSLGGIERP